MQICPAPNAAFRIHEKTLSMITALNGGVTPEIEESPTYFMIYCVGTDHEETDIISEETFLRTYLPMPHPDVFAEFVTTRD